MLDENLNVSIKNNNKLINIVSITADEIDFKNNIKIAGVIIDDYITDIINKKTSDIIANIEASIIQGYLMPDYTMAINITGNFTAAYNGWLIGHVHASYSNTASAYINGIEIAKEKSDYADIQILMNKGDIFITNAASVDLKFLKLKE